jgi:hypothetical protein
LKAQAAGIGAIKSDAVAVAGLASSVEIEPGSDHRRAVVRLTYEGAMALLCHLSVRSDALAA